MLKPILLTGATALSAVAFAGTARANQFLVYVPDITPPRIAQVRAIVPDGFFSNLDNGQRVFQTGRFDNLPHAHKRAQELRQAGFTAEIRTVAPRIATAPVTQPLPGVPSAVDTAAPVPQPIEISRPAPVPQPISSLPPALPPEPITPQNNRFFVIIPTTSQQILQRVKTLSPQARFRHSNRGIYIEVQGFADRAGAEVKSATMRGEGFDARVAFF